MESSGFFNADKNKKLEIREFRQIFLDFYPPLVLYASKFVRDVEVSKDIVQEVLANFWLENEKLRNRNLLKPYLYKAVKNRSLNYKKLFLKKQGLEELIDKHFEDLNYSETSEAFEEINYENLQNDLKSAMDELPKQRKIIFEMSRFKGMKHKEIAAELKISPKTVETQIYRSLLFLREKLKNYLS